LNFLEGGVLIGRLEGWTFSDDAEVHVSDAGFRVSTVKHRLPTGPKVVGIGGARGCEKTAEDLW
jgi:hypothetical protein